MCESKHAHAHVHTCSLAELPCTEYSFVRLQQLSEIYCLIRRFVMQISDILIARSSGRLSSDDFNVRMKFISYTNRVQAQSHLDVACFVRPRQHSHYIAIRLTRAHASPSFLPHQFIFRCAAVNVRRLPISIHFHCSCEWI